MWKPTDIAGFRRDYRAGYTVDQLIAKYHGTLNTISKYIAAEHKAGNLPYRSDKYFPIPETPVYNEYLRIDEDCIVGNDFHAPFYNAQWCDMFVDVAKAQGITTAVIVGDGLNLGAFSSWGANPEYPWSREQDAAAIWLHTMRKHFKKIYWLKGNHEHRISRRTENQMGYRELVRALMFRAAEITGETLVYNPNDGELVFSDYQFSLLGDKWLLAHPGNYSVIAGRVASTLAEKFRRHIVGAHGHGAGEIQTRDGRFYGIELGCMCDILRTDYIWTGGIRTNPFWQNRFAVYKDGFFDVLDDGTNFARWGVDWQPEPMARDWEATG